MSTSPRYRWTLLRAGALWLDGGGMFGLVPRSIWSRNIHTDDRNRIELSHNCLLLHPARPSPGLPRAVLIEAGTGDKFDEKFRDIYQLSNRTVATAVMETGTTLAEIDHAIVTHLHFDHAGGLSRREGDGIVPTFPNAQIHVQRQEWEDASENRSVMTRTYLPENLNTIADRLVFHESPRPFPGGMIPARTQRPACPLTDRLTPVLPGIDVFSVPGHTWGQQAVRFTDDRGQVVVFTPDVMPTAAHVGAAYNLAYDVEPYTSMVSRHWFLAEAAAENWLLVLDHEATKPLVRVRSDSHGWFVLIPETET